MADSAASVASSFFGLLAMSVVASLLLVTGAAAEIPDLPRARNRNPPKSGSRKLRKLDAMTRVWPLANFRPSTSYRPE